MANTPPPNTATPPLKKIAFAFPFRKKGNANSASATDVIDQHEMYLLLKQEPSGTFSVSGNGMWHGALDQHVNRPGFVRRDIGKALDHFFSNHPNFPKDPQEWGGERAQYELEIVEHYGHSREMARVQGISVAPARYAALKSKLV